MAHRSALVVNSSCPVSSTSGLVPGAATSDTVQKPASVASFVQSSKPAAPPQDVEKSVSASAVSIRYVRYGTKLGRNYNAIVVLLSFCDQN